MRLGRLHDRRARHVLRRLPVPRAVDAVRRRAEAAGAGGRCCAGRTQVLLLDEPDNYLDVPGKRWLEAALAETPKTVLFVSHDRELLARTATRVVTIEAHGAWVHGGGFDTYAAGAAGPARAPRRAAQALGRGAREAAQAGHHAARAGEDQPGHGQPLPRDADPVREVRGRRSAAGAGRRPEGRRCGCAAAARACGPSPASAWS